MDKDRSQKPKNKMSSDQAVAQPKPNSVLKTQMCKTQDFIES